MRTSRLTLTDQKRLSRARSSLWNESPGAVGFTCRSKAVVLTAFCSSPVSRARLSVNVSAMRKSTRLDPEDLHDLVAQVVDHLDRDPPRLRLVEGPGRVAVQRFPRLRVNLGLERRLQRLVWV